MTVPGTEWIEHMRDHRVLVIGDPVLDIYINGIGDRVSREAPVVIVQEESRDYRLGGAANTAANLAAFGADVMLVGLGGNDPEAETLSNLARGANVHVQLVPRADGCTITKTRVMAGGLHIRKQQMLRIDRENRALLPLDTRLTLANTVQTALEHADALVISDYGDTTLTELYVELARTARAAGLMVVVDSRHALAKFAGVTAVTPNQPEVEALFGRPLDSAREALAAAEILSNRLGVEVALITRGREGMAVFARNGPGALLPAVGGEAVDVTGAGDTVTAAFTLALLAGAPVVEAARLSNVAAALTVQQVGTAVCTPAELAAGLETLR